MNEVQHHRMEESAALGEAMAAIVQHVLDDWGAETLAQLDRRIYKNTACGAALGIETFDKGFAWSGSKLQRELTVGDVAALGVGSIVEGSDAEVAPRFLRLIDYAESEDGQERFSADLQQLVEDVDKEASALWEEANEDDEEYDDGKTLIAGVLYDDETGEEADPQ